MNTEKKRNSLWISGLQKGILKTLMDGQPSDKLELLVKGWLTKEGSDEAVVPLHLLP